MSYPQCPPTPQVNFDLTSDLTCAQTLQMLFQAYVNATVGEQPVSFRFDRRETTFVKADPNKIRDLYTTLYNQCPEASLTGLPVLTAGRKVRRGPPVQGVTVYTGL